MKKRPDDEILENVYYRQFHQIEQLKPLLSLYIQDTVQKRESRDFTKLNKRWFRTSNRKTVNIISLLVKDNLKSPILALLQGKRAKEK